MVKANESINKEAWDILDTDERTAISLSLGHGKSTWESGEIMGRAHFKYLEIQKRARKFLEMFTLHFEKYDGLFPEGIILSPSFREFIIQTILNRKNISESVKNIDEPAYRVAGKRRKLIIAEIGKLKKSNFEPATDLYGIIMDFDRWNNFRILPSEIQEPSAFKRRNKTRNVKHLKNITSLPPFSLLKIKERFSYRGKYDKVYLPIISIHYENDYKIITVRKKGPIMDDVTRIGLFLFNDRAIAEEFAILVANYFLNSIRDCKSGQKFWPKFRMLIPKSLNHLELENIHKSRTYLDMALFDKEQRRNRVKKEKSLPGEERIPDIDIFYPKE